MIERGMNMKNYIKPSVSFLFYERADILTMSVNSVYDPTGGGDIKGVDVKDFIFK